MNKKPILLIFALVLGIAVVSGAILTGGEQVAQASAMTELNVSNLSCGSCVSKIQNALGGIDGVGQVSVSVTNGRSQVTYDPALISSTKIAKVVTDAGYPASVRLDLTAAEYQQLQAESEQLGVSYIARIGTRLLSRDDFYRIVQLRSGSSLTGSPSPYGDQQLQAQVWKELKEREIMLDAADKNQIVVQNGEVELEINRIKGTNKDFDAAVKARFGSHERFFAQIKENMIINRNIEQNVFAGLSSDSEKQQRFSEWYNNTLQNTNVVIFDSSIKQADAGGGSSCGSSCGG